MIGGSRIMGNFVALDLGASSTRYVSESGQINVLPNNVAFLNNEQVSALEPDNADIESCLEVQIRKTDGVDSEYFPANVLMGILAERSAEIVERPSIISHKYKQRINYISAIVATAISRLKYNLDEDIAMYLAVPPAQIMGARKEFPEMLCGRYDVTFPKYNNGVAVKLNISSVTVYEESFMSVTSFFFNMNGTLKESAKELMAGSVLSLDIGASTCDLTITKNGRFLDKSGQTYNHGGNEIRSMVIDAVRGQYNIDVPIALADTMLAEGRLQLGNTYKVLTNEINDAKTKLAKRLTALFVDYFAKVEVPIHYVNAIVVSGGGSLQSQYVNADGEIVKTSEPMSYFMTQEMLKWSEGTMVVEYGNEARFANVKGLYIRAMVDSMKKKQLGSVPAQPTQQVVQSVQPVQSTQPVTQPVTPAQPVQQVAPTQSEQPATAPVQPAGVQTTAV